MDAAARAELAALRRRAYAADADIANDPRALARLVELEELARAVPAHAAPEDGDAASSDAALTAAGLPRAAQVTASIRPSKRRGWHLALIALTGACAFVLGATAWAQMRTTQTAGSGPPLDAVAAEALAIATDPEGVVLHTLRLDGAAAAYMDPDSASPPAFPIDQPRWQSALGEYYGLDLWITGTLSVSPTIESDETLCLVVSGADETKSRCATRDAWEQGALLLPVPFADLADDERPAQMSDDESLAFWWTDDDSIRVVLGRID
ncbi:hypothetical protein GCM10009775_15240 [Microbacterium aoyamense]|uniref:Anti-sigma-K factor rskA n=2 Tax=Microbacterium aoyamense TaxID=344166 RepID=A0ABN2PN57_9MICO